MITALLIIPHILGLFQSQCIFFFFLSKVISREKEEMTYLNDFHYVKKALVLDLVILIII